MINQNKIQLMLMTACVTLVCACGSHQGTRSPASENNEIGIIGGAPVTEAQKFHEKILYLALGVEMKTDPATGGNHMKWTGHCTASALTKRIILTAAHCLAGQDREKIYVVLTPNPAKTSLEIKDWYSVQDFKIHEAYTGENGFLNDLGLIVLSRDLPDSRLLKIAEPDETPLPLSIVSTGYGTSSESADSTIQGQTSDTLNFVAKVVENFDPSQKTFKINQNDHKGFCSGDSGGPGLIFDSTNQEYKIAGVVSNVSMTNEMKKMMDPEGRFSLCIGEGNYTNVLNPELRSWIEKTQTLLLGRL
jgi:secreted trypsin-like serine protease